MCQVGIAEYSDAGASNIFCFAPCVHSNAVVNEISNTEPGLLVNEISITSAKFRVAAPQRISDQNVGSVVQSALIQSLDVGHPGPTQAFLHSRVDEPPGVSLQPTRAMCPFARRRLVVPNRDSFSSELVGSPCFGSATIQAAYIEHGVSTGARQLLAARRGGLTVQQSACLSKIAR